MKSGGGEGRSKKKVPVKRRSGPAPDVLRKGGAHKDKKRKTGREPIDRKEIDEHGG